MSKLDSEAKGLQGNLHEVELIPKLYTNMRMAHLERGSIPQYNEGASFDASPLCTLCKPVPNCHSISTSSVLFQKLGNGSNNPWETAHVLPV
jgi:hypothetical protein